MFKLILSKAVIVIFEKSIIHMDVNKSCSSLTSWKHAQVRETTFFILLSFAFWAAFYLYFKSIYKVYCNWKYFHFCNIYCIKCQPSMSYILIKIPVLKWGGILSAFVSLFQCFVFTISNTVFGKFFNVNFDVVALRCKKPLNILSWHKQNDPQIKACIYNKWKIIPFLVLMHVCSRFFANIF